MLYSRVRRKRSHQTQASLQGRVPDDDDVDTFPRDDATHSSSRCSSSLRSRSRPSSSSFLLLLLLLLLERNGARVFIASPLSSSCSSPAPRRRPSLLSFVSISRRRNLCSRLCARPRRPRRQKRRRSPTRGRRRSSVLPFRLRNALLDVAWCRPSSSVEIYLCTKNALKFFSFFPKEGNLEEKKVPQKNVLNWKPYLSRV